MTETIISVAAIACSVFAGKVIAGRIPAIVAMVDDVRRQDVCRQDSDTTEEKPPISPRQGGPYGPPLDPVVATSPISSPSVAASSSPPAPPTTSLPDARLHAEPEPPTIQPEEDEWATVVTRKKKKQSSRSAEVITASPPEDLDQHKHAEAPAQASPFVMDGCVDLYEEKESFYRGWQRSAKQSRSVKSKRKVDYQVDKRKAQSTRDRGRNMAMFAGDGSDCDE